MLLIGDSIRMGYQETVGRELAGAAEVWGPAENGGHSGNVLAHLQEWALSKPAAVIHVNCGLHDLKREFGAGRTAIPVDQYEANVRQILQVLLCQTQARVIWATTTPVNERWHHERKGFDRFEADVELYNRVARRVARELGVRVDDLFAVVMEAGRDRLLGPDGVHFTPEGYQRLGQAVAAAIRGCM